jgi:electron transfer flavoprotein beta subunit
MEKENIKIVVCIKVIHQLASERGFDPVKKTIDPEYMVRMVNPSDEYAMEIALFLKEEIQNKGARAEIITFSIAQADDEGILKRCLAMGADRAIRVWEIGFETLRGAALAYLLSAGIRKIGGDFIFCGKKALDSNGNEVGGYLAEFLQFPQISGVTSVELSEKGNGLVCRRRVERLGWDLVETRMPVVLSVERAENEPRYPNVYSILKWLGKEIELLDGGSIGIETNQLKEWDSIIQIKEWSRPKPKKVFTPKSDLPPEERIRLAMTGGVDKKKTNFLQGEKKEIVSQMIDLLNKQKFIKEGGEK